MVFVFGAMSTIIARASMMKGGPQVARPQQQLWHHYP